MQICVKPNFHSALNQTHQTRADQTSPVLQGWVDHIFGICYVNLSNQVHYSFQITRFDTAVARSNQMLRSLSRGHNPYQMHSATAREQQKLFPEASAPCFPIDLFLLMLMPKPQVLRLKLELELESKHFQRHNRREAWVQLAKVLV